MNSIIPAIIPQSFDHLRDAFHVLQGNVEEIQIDIVDGSFVPFTSWPYRGSGSVMLIREYTDRYQIEVDLMVENPEQALPLYVDAGARKIVVHIESVTDLETIYAHHRAHEYQLGLSIGNDTPLEVLKKELSHADYVQLMGIRNIGTQGQPFDTAVLDRIAELRTSYPDLIISIDGSVNAESLPLLRAAGANRFVAGSAIFSATDPVEAYRSLTLI